MSWEGEEVLDNVVVLHPRDNVGNAVEDIASGQAVAFRDGEKAVSFPAAEKIPFGFKVAVAPIAQGDEVLKYGEVIGKASRGIQPGELVHVHNMEGRRGRGDLVKP